MSKKPLAIKLPKGVSQQFVDGLNTASTVDLKSIIVTLQVQNQENEEFKLSDAFTQAQAEYDHAKEVFDQVAGPVKEVTTSLKNRTKIVVERLKEKGGA